MLFEKNCNTKSRTEATCCRCLTEFLELFLRWVDLSPVTLFFVLPDFFSPPGLAPPSRRPVDEAPLPFAVADDLPVRKGFLRFFWLPVSNSSSCMYACTIRVRDKRFAYILEAREVKRDRQTDSEIEYNKNENKQRKRQNQSKRERRTTAGTRVQPQWRTNNPQPRNFIKLFS